MCPSASPNFMPWNIPILQSENVDQLIPYCHQVIHQAFLPSLGTWRTSENFLQVLWLWLNLNGF